MTMNGVTLLAALLAFSVSAEGFFLYSNKKTSTERVMPPPNYYRDAPQHVPWGQQYAFDGAGPVTVALPVAVPIQAQMASMPASLKGRVHDVQLVPCLCPVSRDIEHDYSSFIQKQPQQQAQQPASYVVQSSQTQPPP